MPAVGQPESSGSTSVCGSAEDVVFHPDNRRVRDLQGMFAGRASTSCLEEVVTSGCMSAQPQPEEAATEAVLIPTQASLLRSVQEMLLN